MSTVSSAAAGGRVAEPDDARRRTLRLTVLLATAVPRRVYGLDRHARALDINPGCTDAHTGCVSVALARVGLGH